MTKSELDKWAGKISEGLSSNEELTLSEEESKLFSIKDLMYLFLTNDLSCMRDHAGNIKFTGGK